MTETTTTIMTATQQTAIRNQQYIWYEPKKAVFENIFRANFKFIRAIPLALLVYYYET